MLENFHIAAIVRNSGQMDLRHVPLRQDLQASLGEGWEDQFAQFTSEIDEVDFDPGYRPERHERLRLNGYSLPDWLNNETSQTIRSLEPLGLEQRALESIRGIVGFGRDDQGEEVVLFQNFTRSRVIRPNRFILRSNDSYIPIEQPGLTLDVKLSAVYQPTARKLLFSNFYIVNTFLPLDEFYREASEEEIREVLSHRRLTVENLDATVTAANQWFNRRISMLRDSEILDHLHPSQIKDRSNGYNVVINIADGKIVFPSDKNAAKRLLQFLVEELYVGPLTDTLYETNSKRPAD